MFKALLQLPKTIWLIGVISFINDCASEMLYPLMPLYLATVLMAGPKTLGLIEGVAEATSSLVKLFSGVLVDYSGRPKKFIVFGYTLAAISRPLILLTNSWIWVMFVRFSDRVGKRLRTSPRDALLAASASSEQRGLVYGFHRAMDNAGAVFGPLLAAMFISMHVSLEHIFLWAIIPGVVTVALTLMLKDPPTIVQIQPTQFSWNMAAMPKQFKHYLVALALFTLGCSSDMFILLRARELGLSLVEIPLVWAGINLMAAIFGTPLSALSDRWGRRNLLIFGWGAYVLFYVLMALMPRDSQWIYLLFAGYGLFKASTEGVEKAFVADIAPPGLVGTAFGWFNLIAGVMLFPASFIFGWLYESISPSVAFGFSGICGLLGIIVLQFWVFRSRQEIIPT